MKPFLLIVNLAMNIIFSSHWFFFPKKFEYEYVIFFSRIIILFQWNNGCCLFFRCGNSTKNHAMWYPFVPIIIVFVIILLNSSIIAILLTVVLYLRLWLIIQGIVLSTIFRSWSGIFYLKRFVFGITIFWSMGDTWQLIGGLVPIILTEIYSEDYCFPC